MKPLLFAILLTPPALAADTPNWRQTSELIRRANDQTEFLALRAEFPQYFSEFDAERVCYASLFVNHYQYRGETRCPAGDARLTHVHVTRGLCLMESDERPHHYVYRTDWPGEGDPCTE